MSEELQGDAAKEVKTLLLFNETSSIHQHQTQSASCCSLTFPRFSQVFVNLELLRIKHLEGPVKGDKLDSVQDFKIRHSNKVCARVINYLKYII